jgi:pyruvate, water dikinase
MLRIFLFGTMFLAACTQSLPAVLGVQTITPSAAPQGPCAAVPEVVPGFLTRIGCRSDFDQLAATPLDASLPGARSMKVVLDLRDGNKLYFQNTNTYPIHWEFASKNLSGNGKPVVPLLSSFNRIEYFLPDRDFLLGAVTYYAGPKIFVLEIAPYDTASADMIATLYNAVKANAYFGPDLLFHPTSTSVEVVAQALPATVPFVSNGVLFQNIDYQPLNLATSYGLFRFLKAENLTTEYISFRNILVLDRAPNDISVVTGIITEEFQTPLSHLNVLSQNRKTPNMGLRGAFTNPALRALDGKWVKMTVTEAAYSVTEVPFEEAEAWWLMNKPAPAGVPNVDLVTTDLRDIEFLVAKDKPLLEAIRASIPTFGGKASHASALSHIPDLPLQKSFAIPIAHYMKFMRDNGFNARVSALLADPLFKSSIAERDRALGVLRRDMMHARVDNAFSDALVTKLRKEFPGARMRFRSSTNGEDLEGFTGAGLYESMSGAADDPKHPLLDAIRGVWGSVWNLRAFEEREYRGIDHFAIGMGMLVHRTYLNEEANGVALTGNPFDTSGLNPAFYINAQPGDVSVTRPGVSETPDEFLYYYEQTGQPTVYLAHSSNIDEGKTVLSREQAFELGGALKKVHEYFLPAYGSSGGFYGLEVDYKFNFEPGQAKSVLYIKQARPHPGRGN